MIAAQKVVVRVAAIARLRDFIARYRRARDAWLLGTAARFPFGTYWLRRFAGVPVDPAPPAPAR